MIRCCVFSFYIYLMKVRKVVAVIVVLYNLLSWIFLLDLYFRLHLNESLSLIIVLFTYPISIVGFAILVIGFDSSFMVIISQIIMPAIILWGADNVTKMINNRMQRF